MKTGRYAAPSTKKDLLRRIATAQLLDGGVLQRGIVTFFHRSTDRHWIHVSRPKVRQFDLSGKQRNQTVLNFLDRSNNVFDSIFSKYIYYIYIYISTIFFGARPCIHSSIQNLAAKGKEQNSFSPRLVNALPRLKNPLQPSARQGG